MDTIGPGELLLIVAAIALLFGAKRLPEVARSLGRARSEFRKGLEEGERSASASKPESAGPGSARLDEGPGSAGPGEGPGSAGLDEGPGSAEPDEGKVETDRLTPGSGA